MSRKKRKVADFEDRKCTKAAENKRSRKTDHWQVLYANPSGAGCPSSASSVTTTTPIEVESKESVVSSGCTSDEQGGHNLLAVDQVELEEQKSSALHGIDMEDNEHESIFGWLSSFFTS